MLDSEKAMEETRTGQQLDELHRLGQAAWPNLTIAADMFAAHIGKVARDGELPAPEYASDVFLACACALEVRGAAEAFDASFAADLGRTIARIDSDQAFVADALQTLRERLLLRRDSEMPRIGEYMGRSSLRTWLTTTASRTALNLRRNKDEQSHDQVRSDALVEAIPPELMMLRARYKPELEAAIREAVLGLEQRERALLRLNIADSLSIDALAKMYGVGRSTAARWLAAARDSLAERTRACFCARAKISLDEYDSIADALRSDLEVSLAQQLASQVA